MTIHECVEAPPSTPPLEDLIPEARQRTRGRRLRLGASVLVVASVSLIAGFAGGWWNAEHPSAATSPAPRGAALAAECTSASHVALSSSYQGDSGLNVFHITLLNRGASACSLRGVPVIRFVDGPRHLPVGPADPHVANDQTTTSLQLGPHSSQEVSVWTYRPAFVTATACGRWMAETGLDLSFGATTFYVRTFASSPSTTWSLTGACSRTSLISQYDVGGF